MGGTSRIYLDTNIFISAFERKDTLGLQLGQLFTACRVLPVQPFATSELTISELLVMPYRHGDTDMIGAYEKMMVSNEWLQVSSVTKPILKRAAWFRSLAPSIKLPDAIHLATAVDAGCTQFLTDDLGISKAKLPPDSALTILRPDEATLASLLESLAE